MLNLWLCFSQRSLSPYKGFLVVDVSEKQPPTVAIEDHLEGLVRNASLDPAFLRDAASYLGWNNVHALLDTVLPHGVTARRGQFGEVLSASMLEQFYGYAIPVQKLRFAIIGDQSLPGTDVLALRLDGQKRITEVCYVESKLRTTNDTGAALHGYEQLKHYYEERPFEMLRFVAQRLHERNDPLSAEFMRYMRSRQDTTNRDTFRLFLTWEQSAWSEKVLENLEDNDVELERLTVHVTQVRSLAQLTEKIFHRMGAARVVDDD